MRTCAFLLSIFMSLLYKTSNERLVISYPRTRCYPNILKLYYTLITLLAVPPYLSPQFFNSSFCSVLIMTHCYWVLLRPPTKVGQWGRGLAETHGKCWLYQHFP